MKLKHKFDICVMIFYLIFEMKSASYFVGLRGSWLLLNMVMTFLCGIHLAFILIEYSDNKQETTN